MDSEPRDEVVTRDPNELVKIRCPHNRYFPEYKRFLKCNATVSEVFPGSSGRGWCWKCRKAGNDPNFWYEVSPDYRAKTIKVIHAKKLDQK